MPTEAQIKEAGKLYALGLQMTRVAAYFGVSEPTFSRAVKKSAALREELSKAEASVVGKVSATAYEMAASGKHPVMTIFFLKCRGGWKDRTTIEVETKPKGLLDDPDHQVTQRATEVVEEFKGLLAELKRVPDSQNQPADPVPVLPEGDPPPLPPGEAENE